MRHQNPTSWRRGWDSNPRYAFTYTRFPSVRLKPLGHLSGGLLLGPGAAFFKSNALAPLCFRRAPAPPATPQLNPAPVRGIRGPLARLDREYDIHDPLCLSLHRPVDP